MPSSTILLVDADPAAAQLVADVLTGAGHAVTTATDGDEGFRRAAEHDLVVIDILPTPTGAADLCKEIRATPALAAIPVLCISQSDDVEERIAFLEVGADDVVAKPFDSRELEARVEALVLRFQRSRQLAPATVVGRPDEGPRRMVAVFSPKGGVGSTTIATNLGMVLARRKPDSTVVVDLALQFGQVATHLNLIPRLTLADLVRDDTALAEAELLRTYTTRHDRGLHVLASPGSPDLAGLVTAAHVERVLTTILGTFDSVIVDAGSTLDERTFVVFEHAQTVIFPVYPEIAALKALHSLLDYLNESGSVMAKATFVLNSILARELVRVRDVEVALGSRVSAHLPYDPFLYVKAVNEGIPIVVGAPRSAPAEAFMRLADLVFSGDPTGAPLPHVEERRGMLGGLLRRG